MSFSCPHYNPSTDHCSRVRDLCVCGRPGCVLARNSTFAIPVEIRLHKAEAAQLDALGGASCPDPLDVESLKEGCRSR